jgi:NhaB family Na+:H+ antiporter
MSNSKLGNFLVALGQNFMGDAPNWYKYTILAFLIANPILSMVSPFLCGWTLVAEFIFTLAMALKCYPLLPGGLLAIEALAIGLTDVGQVKAEIDHNLEVLLLLMFMVAGIHFVRELLLLGFTQILIKVRSKVTLSFIFCLLAAFLSAFLDALTVLAVIITVCYGFYAVYHHSISSEDTPLDKHDNITQVQREDLDGFRAFLRTLLMHASVGTALGGICTIVGEPQNLIIGEVMGWNFAEFAIRVSPVSLPVLICGLTTTIIVEKFSLFGFGAKLPENVYEVLKKSSEEQVKHFTINDKVSLFFQTIICIWLVIALALHLAAVGLVGLSIIILATNFTGVNNEGKIGQAFTESLPFASLLCVFFTIVAVIGDQKLFAPIMSYVLSVEPQNQLPLFYMANGLLSMISDNVFVATVYITDIQRAFAQGVITQEQFNLLAMATNSGTNLPSVATPNGQAAFLFLLTSAISPLIRLSYGRMFLLALPYTFVLTFVGLACTWFLLPEMTTWFVEMGWLPK